MKKMKTLLFSSVPLLVALTLQTAAMFYLLIIAAIFLVSYSASHIDSRHSITELFYIATDMDFMQVVYIVFAVWCIICFGIWFRKRCGGTWKVDFSKTFHPYEILGIVCLIPGTQYLSAIITSIISMVFPNWLDTYEELIETAGITDDITLVMFVYAVILAPISEELIFRGVTLRIAQRAFPFWIANIIQAFFFGAFHMNMLQECYTFILGLFLGYICHKGGSIYHVILFHFLFNLWGTTLTTFFAVENAFLQGIFILAGTVFGLILGLYFFQKGNESKKLLHTT